MRIIKIAGTILLSIWTVMAQANAAPKYTIKGTFYGISDGTVIELIPSGTHADEKPIASTKIKAGHFNFQGSVKTPRLFRISSHDYNGGCTVMISNTNIEITATASLDDRGDAKFLNLKNLKVTGSTVHDEYLKKVAFKDQFEKNQNTYFKKNEAISQQMADARQAKDSVKVDSLIKTSAWKQLEADERAFFNNLKEVTLAQIEANKNSWWGPFLMLNSYSYFTPDEQPLFKKMSKIAQESYYGQVVKSELFPKELTGKAAPLFSAVTNDHVDANLIALTKGHKYTLIDFWASWCAPCRKSIPALKSLYKDLSSKGLQIISISIDKKEADWLKAEKEEQFAWPSVIDQGTTATAWTVNAIPAMFLLDESGKVVAANVSLEQVRGKLK